MSNRNFIPSMIIAVLTTLLFILDQFINSETISFYHYLWMSILILISFMLISLTIWSNKLLPVAHTVATIGFPKSGKTTLITALFSELFANRLGIQAIPRGLETIERVNENIAKLEVGKSVGATTDKDVFAYRIDVIRGKLFKDRYKVEIGDFPGEDSEQFTKEFGYKFHHTPYFKWAMEADVFMFIIDLAPVLAAETEYGTPQEYVATMTQAIRAAWQRLGEYHYEGGRSLSKKPAVLVFTKADLFGIAGEVADLDQVTEEIIKFGFNTVPPLSELDAAKLKTGQETVLKLFAELIGYMKNQNSNFQTIFVSCFSFEQGQKSEIKQRLGIKRLLDAILP